MLRLRPKFLSVCVLSAALALLSTTSFAADPECVDATTEPPVFSGCQLKLDGLQATLRFCSPQFDTDGDPILETGHIASCTVELNGQAVAVATVDRPGQLFEVTVNGKNPGHRIGAFCTTTEGADGEKWESDMCFPHGNPKKPKLRQ